MHRISILVSLSVISLLFAMMFKWLPDADVNWYDVWLGAVITAVFFEIGKAAIGFYIGKQGLEAVDLRCRRLDHRRINLGVLHSSDHSHGCRGRPSICQAPGLDQGARCRQAANRCGRHRASTLRQK